MNCCKVDQSLLKVKKSKIKGAGRGLFYIGNTVIPKNTKITLYSGSKVYTSYPHHVDSTYLLQVTTNQYINSSSENHALGRFINSSYKSGKKANTRYSCGNIIYKKGKSYFIPIFTTRKIKPGDELLINYGNCYF